MIGQRLRLAGRFVEAFLYFDFLWLLTEDGEVWAFDTAAYLSDKLGLEADAATNVFAHNDLLPRNAFGDVDISFRTKLTQSIGSDGFDLTEREVQRFSRVFKSGGAVAKSILDFRCYYGRGFVATDCELRQLRMLGRSDLQHVHLGGRGNGALGGDKVADFRCRQLRTNLGLVSAAAGPDGAWYAAGALSDDPAWRAKFTKFAGTSTATEVMGGAMTSVAGAEDISIFKTDIHQVQRASRPLSIADDQEQPPEEISEVAEKLPEITDRLRNQIVGREEASEVIFTRTFLSKSKVFAVDDDDQIYTISLADKGKLVDPAFKSKFPAAPGRILSMTFVANGRTVVELDDEVCILNFQKRSWERVFEGEVYSARGYPGSRWYKNLLTCVGEDRVELRFIT